MTSALHDKNMRCEPAPTPCGLGKPHVPAAGELPQPSGSWAQPMSRGLQMSGHSGYDPDSLQALEAAQFRANYPLSDADPHMSDWNGGVCREQLRHG